MTDYDLLKADSIALRQALWEVATKSGKFSFQREFADAVGMIPSAFYRFFQNDNDSKSQKKTIDAMAKALGITELTVRRTHQFDEFLNRSKRGKIQG